MPDPPLVARVDPHALFVSEAERLRFEREVLPSYLRRSRWFAGKASDASKLSVSETMLLGASTHWAFVDIDYADGGRETYQLLLAVVTPTEAARHPEAALVPDTKADRVLVDALHFDFAREALWKLMATGGVRRGERGEVAGVPRAGLDAELARRLPASRLLKVEQSNSSLVYNERVFLKLYRKLEAGVNPDAELTRFLSERQGFGHVPPFIGALEYRTTDREPRVLGLAVGLVKNRGDAWAWALAQLRALYERAEGSADREFLARVRQLGARTGEMHRALARDATDPAFAPEPLTLADMREVADRIRAAARELPVLLAEKAPGAFSGSARQLASAIEGRATQLAEGTVTGAKIRTHGDYHLGQVLETGDDFVILDFEGEPLRPLAYRRQKRSPLRDVAGMLRSFHYAAHAVLVGRADRAALEPRAEQWAEDANRAFLDGWLEVARGTAFLPATEAEIERLLDAFLLEKVIYEVSYELNNRPDWIAIPALGLRRALRLA
ncbi:MAG TPA: putative maltokinase [Chthoniobacterales bacterium]